jgi:hypothetical protein
VAIAHSSAQQINYCGCRKSDATVAGSLRDDAEIDKSPKRTNSSLVRDPVARRDLTGAYRRRSNQLSRNALRDTRDSRGANLLERLLSPGQQRIDAFAGAYRRRPDPGREETDPPVPVAFANQGETTNSGSRRTPIRINWSTITRRPMRPLPSENGCSTSNW